MVVEEVARLIAQHLVPDLPVQVLLRRRVEQFGDPGREQRLVGGVPAIAHLPDGPCRNPELRLLAADGDLAGKGVAIPAARKRRAPGAGGGCGDLGEPGIWRTVVTVGGFDGRSAV